MPVAEASAEPGSRVAIGRWQFERAAVGVAGACLAYIVLTIWWVLTDNGLPGGGDPGIHLYTASNAGELIKDFDLGGLIDLGPVGTEFFYPPLVHLIGGVPAALGLAVQDWGVVAMNLVFVPMLAAGVYLTGKRVYGPTAGLLAAIFALGTPMALSLFHVFVLDAPLSASIALTVAALVYSERFEVRRPSILAGVMVGLAFLIKPSAPLYLIGPVAVMILGGGWRQWRNVGLAAIAALIVAGPYYLIHLHDVLDLGEASTVGTELGRTGTAFDRDARISYNNLSWYSWAAVNQVYFVPLLAFFFVGLVGALRRFRRPGMLELLAGVVVTYLLLALVLSIRDARYSLPLIVYVSVIGTGWITTVSRALVRRAVLALLGLVVAANVLASITPVPDLRLLWPNTRIELDNDPGTFTFLDDRGYFVGPPNSNDLWIRLFEAAEREGITTAQLEIRNTGLWSEDPIVFDDIARQYGVREVTFYGGGKPELKVYTWFVGSRFKGLRDLLPACGALDDGLDFYGEPLLMNVAVRRLQPDGSYEPWCDF